MGWQDDAIEIKEPLKEDASTKEKALSWLAEAKEIESHPSELESFARGAAQAGTMGFSDELAGGAEALWEKAKGNPTEFGKLYEKYRNESRQNNEAAKKENPYSFGTGIFAGSVPLAPVPAPLQGAITGLGEAETSNPDELTKEAAKGAAFATAGGKLGKYLGNKLGGAVDSEATRNALKSAEEGLLANAERMGARALGAERGTIKKLGEEKVLDSGRYALDNGVISEGFRTGKNPLNWIFPGANTEAMIEKNQALKERAGKGLQDVYETIDKNNASVFNPEAAARVVEERLGDFWRSPINKSESHLLDNILESIRMRGKENIPLGEAQALKQELGKVANWKNSLNPTDKEKMAREAYGIVNEMIDRSVEHGANKVSPSLGEGVANPLTEKLRTSLKDYGRGKTADQLLENRNAREQGNKLIGLTDTIAGSGGISSGGNVVGGILGVKKGLEGYGAQGTALLSDRLAEIAKNTPERLGKFREAIDSSLQRGGRSAAITHYLLQQQNPEYQELMKSLNENQEDQK
jgi:hypothetical protein